MSDPAPLIGGPYAAPVVKFGDWLDDEIDGALQVGGWSAGPIPWPRRLKTGRHSLILCGDLLLAVRQESSEAIQQWFGVGPVTVAKWRRALGVSQSSPGTMALKAIRHPGIPAAAAAAGRNKALSPESRAKISAAKLGKPATPATRTRLLAAAHAPKPPGWGCRAHEWMEGGKFAARSAQAKKDLDDLSRRLVAEPMRANPSSIDRSLAHGEVGDTDAGPAENPAG